MTERSRASVLVSPEQFELRDFALPEIGADAGLLKVEACGVCGSDVREFRRQEPGPRILGHENVGTVERIGAAASRRWGVREGDRVALEEYVPCGACRWCRTEDFRFCEQTERSGAHGPRLWYGSTPLAVWPALWGGYSEYLYLHPNAVVHRLPSHLPPEQATLFLPFSNGVEWTLRYGGVELGQSVLVQGPGQQGLACVIAAREAGAGCIIVSGLARDARRLEIARALGAHHTIDVEAEDLTARVRAITGGEGVDVVVNVSGGMGTVAAGLAVAGKRSTVVLAAPPNEPIAVGSIGRRNVVLKWAHGHSYRSVELAIQLIASGKYPLEAIATHTFGLEGVSHAIRAVAGEGAAGAIHVSVIP